MGSYFSFSTWKKELMLEICEFLNFRDLIDCHFVTLYIPSTWFCFAFFLIGRQENILKALEKWHTKVHNVFFLIGKKRSNIKRGAKKAIQGIQNLYTHHQNGQKRRKTPNWPNKTTLIRTQPINKTNHS